MTASCFGRTVKQQAACGRAWDSSAWDAGGRVAKCFSNARWSQARAAYRCQSVSGLVLVFCFFLCCHWRPWLSHWLPESYEAYELIRPERQVGPATLVICVRWVRFWGIRRGSENTVALSSEVVSGLRGRRDRSGAAGIRRARGR